MSKRMRSEVLESASFALYWATIGALMASLASDTKVVFFACFGLWLVLAVLNWLSVSSSTTFRAAEKLDALRYRGIYPPEGKGTNEDVKRLKASGERVLAIQLHREIHGGTLRGAIDAVNAL